MLQSDVFCEICVHCSLSLCVLNFRFLFYCTQYCNSVRMACSIKRLLTYLLTYLLRHFDIFSTDRSEENTASKRDYANNHCTLAAGPKRYRVEAGYADVQDTSRYCTVVSVRQTSVSQCQMRIVIFARRRCTVCRAMNQDSAE